MQTTLPLLEDFREQICNEISLNLEHVIFVCVQHLLGTTVELFKNLLALNIPAHNIFLMGKNYSQSPDAMQELLNLGIYVHNGKPQLKIGIFSETFENNIKDFWEYILSNIKNRKTDAIVILDDGGFCLVGAPSIIFDKYNVVGIEQTTAGTMRSGIESVACPIVQVALSAAKKELESPIIATAIAQKIGHLIAKKNCFNCGIVGAGAIGKAVGKKLTTLGYTTTFYDKEKRLHPLMNWTDNINGLIQRNDIIFGCSGTDIFYQLELESLFNGNKIFASCSSEDKEFLTLLKWLGKESHLKCSENPLQNIFYTTTKNHEIQIVRGGFPINFDNIKEIESAKDIQLTRTLLLGGIFQSLMCIQENIGEKKTKYILHPEIQRYIALKWLMLSMPQNSHEFLDKFSNTKWIVDNSQGHYLHSPMITKIFSFANEHAIAI